MTVKSLTKRKWEEACAVGNYGVSYKEATYDQKKKPRCATWNYRCPRSCSEVLLPGRSCGRACMLRNSAGCLA